jgi:predicted extracellular nuclease
MTVNSYQIAKKKWNTYRYNYKLSQIEKVFISISKDLNNNNLPDVIGLCEVENRLVIDDLLNTPIFKNQNYSIVHQDSPDNRGIDCALIFNSKFKILKKDFIVIENPAENRPTRDIVFVKLKLKDKIINIFVNHWPSRWGGQDKSNHKRVFVAKVLKDYINLNTSDDEYTIIMGDFNDYPNNESLSKFLMNDQLINLMSTNLVSGKGSYNYKGNWDWLDQIIISKNFKNPIIKLLSAGAFQKDFLFYKNKNGEIFPSRSFGGDNWYGGFSDHLPIYFKSEFLY